MRPIADAVTEMQVQTGSTSAEYGSYLGVHINVVTKSGTNTPHGAVFEFFQDDALDARGYFENRAHPEESARRNQFGAQMDGPLVIPKLYDGRNKTFFMGAYEGVRGEALTSPFVIGADRADAAGEFLRDHHRRSGIRSRASRFAGNIIPQSMLSPMSLDSCCSYYPAPNLAGHRHQPAGPERRTATTSTSS